MKFCLRPQYNPDDFDEDGNWKNNDIKWKRAKQMNQMIIENWNDVVKPQDTVYHLGDVCMGRKKDVPEIIQKLNGNIHLIRGNHDGRYMDIYEEEFESVSYQRYLDLDFAEKDVILTHRPQDRDYDRFTICGHIHEKWKFLPNRLNVGVDVWDFKPVPLKYIQHYYESNEWHKEKANEKGYIYDKERFVHKLEKSNLIEGLKESIDYDDGS